MKSSIRKQLFTLFVPVLLGLCAIGATASYWLVSSFSGESFDRELISSADSVVGRLRLREGKVFADLPPAAIAILKHDDSDKFYYRVVGEDGKNISGDLDLPSPTKNLRTDIPQVSTASIKGKAVRLAEIKTSLDDENKETVIIQVAETTKVRTKLREKLLLSIAVPQFAIVVLAIFAVWYGVARIMTPLKRLQEQLENRSPSDLSAVSDSNSPAEVLPLVKTLNLVLERSREELKAQQRFIANAAHQLRTPLAGLKTYSSIGSEMTDAAELQHIVGELDAGVDRASRMVTQLLALARTDVHEPTVSSEKNHVDLNFLASDVVSDLIQLALRKKIELNLETSQNAATVSGDESGLRHLVSNLVENAILYTPYGGNVTVRVRHHGALTLSVSDTGSGIPEEEREKVFERFYRVVGTSGNGSGLGLSIVKEVASNHRASVSIESGLQNKGTVIVVRFPD